MDPKLDVALKAAEAKIQRILLILDETLQIDHTHKIDSVAVDAWKYANLRVEIKVRPLP